jgi:hypothetical protein
MQATGSASLEATCNGAGCDTGASASSDGALSTAFAIGADLLIGVTDLVRLGPSLTYTHTTDVKKDSGGTGEVGSITSFDGVVELAPKVAPTVWIVPRIAGGLAMLNPSGGLKDGLQNLANACDKESAKGCSSLKGVHFGYHVGGGVGVAFAVNESFRVRADLFGEYFAFGLGEISDSSATATLSISGTRYFLMVGAEI